MTWKIQYVDKKIAKFVFSRQTEFIYSLLLIFLGCISVKRIKELKT